MIRLALLSLTCIALAPIAVTAQGKAAVAREAAEVVLGRFGKEAAKEGVQGLTRKIELLAVKHGDDAIVAVKKVGPGTFRLVEEAGEHGAEAVKIMAKHGDEAVWVIAKKDRMAIFVKYGENAGDAMVRHKELAEPLLDLGGKSAAGALKSVSVQNGRRLAMMQGDGELARIGRTPELFDVVGKYGDRAMEFIWKHKGALAVTAALSAFLANPEPFINGTADIAKVVGENAMKPLAEATGQAAVEVVRGIDWTLVTLCGLCLGGCLVGIWLLRRPQPRLPKEPSNATLGTGSGPPHRS